MKTTAPPPWFAPPACHTERPRQSMFSGRHRQRAATVVDQIASGELALAPWQRPAVWSVEQRIALFDSMMRGIAIGMITLWSPPADVGHRDFPGCTAANPGMLVVDGQQRLLALLAATRGELDDWRWDGCRWSLGPGHMTPSIAMGRQVGAEPAWDWYGWLRSSIGNDEQALRAAVDEMEAMSSTDLELLVLDGPAEHMVETYRVMATHGSPHSPADLAVMDAWMRDP